MRFALFCHSFVSCWNHGNAHFLRGIARELIRLGHEVSVHEPQDGWSRTNLLQDHGPSALDDAACIVPGVKLCTYRPEVFDADGAVDGADVVLVHEWTDPELVARLGECRIQGGRFILLFHDTHHRAVTAPQDIEKFRLEGYDGVLAFGEVLRKIYLQRGWGRQVFTWHEAADTVLFRPLTAAAETDLIWIGNWGDGERDKELQDFLLEPVSILGLRARLHGVRYPQNIRQRLAARQIQYAGWIPNHRVPEAFARARVTVHVPRRPYVEALPGVPTIRMFEALACGIPLVSALWRDIEGLFPSGSYLSVTNADQMTVALSLLLRDPQFAARQVQIGLDAIRARHTCHHRVEALMHIISALRSGAEPRVPVPAARAEQVVQL